MPVYSHSRLSSYENCPLQYKYRYIDRIRTDFESIEAFMGKKVHETLEAVYADLDRAREAGVEEIVTLFHRKWNDGMTPSVRVIRPDMTADDYLEIGERCVRSFWELNYPFRIDPEKLIGLECRVDIALDKERHHRMMGYIDRLQHAEPGVIEIHDYKTSAKLPWRDSLADDRQLPLYEMGIRQQFPQTHTVRLIWHYLAHGRTYTEIRTRQQLDRIRRSCIALIGTVERAREFPAKKGPLCAWCSYQEMCPEWETEKPVASPAYPEGRAEKTANAAPPGAAPVPEEKGAASETSVTPVAKTSTRHPSTEKGGTPEDPSGEARSNELPVEETLPPASPAVESPSGAGEASRTGDAPTPPAQGKNLDEKGDVPAGSDTPDSSSKPQQLSLF